MTALPIIETLLGDVSAYVPTNVISITDGQIYLEPELFMSGMRPAVNAGLSVSRVGSAAQSKAMKSVAGRLRLELAQYRELATFAQFGTSDLDAATRAQLERGQRAVEVLKQVQDSPFSLAQEVCVLFTLINGILDDVDLTKIADFEKGFQSFLEASHPEIIKSINDTKNITEETAEALTKAGAEFKSSVPY